MTTITLAFPITVDGAKVKSLTLRRPKVRDMLAADHATGSDAEKEVALFANLAELTREAILDLDGKDYRALQEAYSGFLS